ncbi:DEAD/DEAH box helicase [Spiroplasma taiwanense]|uniref:Superfamily I DNA/RNA helicase n=1 Tax=Spiroplasma taiwanense CT-1 TaxID=1276220 RepID=S5MAR6_9MOLU|nr:AAA domain-containing protein [Spiroplasma taiwanense]AGR40853.1 superfamily I DNA/RNA helicase [Spiroplasma taiwanense CT-1]
MANIIENNNGKEIVLDFSFLQNVQFKENISGLDQIIEKLEIKGIISYNDFHNFLRNSLVKKAFLCLIDNKTRQLSKKDKTKETYDGIIRVELDSRNQSLLLNGTYLGFFVNIDSKNATLIISSIFLTRLKPIAQEFETVLNECQILLIRNQGQIKEEEILRRNILNSSTIQKIGRLISTFEEEKNNWNKYLEFSEDLLKIKRKRSLPYFNSILSTVLRIDINNSNSELHNFELHNLKSYTYKYLKLDSENILKKLNIQYDKKIVVCLEILVDDIEKLNKLKKMQDLSIVPFKFNRNISTTHELLKDIKEIFNFDFEKNHEVSQIVNLSTMIGVNETNLNFWNYWENKNIIIGSKKELEELLETNLEELKKWKIFKINFEIDENFNENLFSVKNNLDFLTSGYLAYTGIGEEVLIERGRQVLKRISEGNTKNPYLINYLFNTKLIELSENSNELYLKDFNFNLNKEQKDAVQKAINSKDIFLLQGPPGTGKTQVICEIIFQLSKLNRKILISSQNHEAIKNVIDRLPIGPNLNKIRLTNNIDFNSSLVNNFSPDRVLYNYYKSIGKKIFDDVNNDENLITEFQEIKNKLEELIISNKSYHKNNTQIRNIQKDIDEINRQINLINEKEINKIKRKNFIKENLLNINNLVDSLNEKEFISVLNFSEIIQEFFDSSIKFELYNYIFRYLKFNPEDFSNKISLLKEVVNEIFIKNEIFMEIKNIEKKVLNYKRQAEFDLANEEESRKKGLLQILNRDVKINELNQIFKNFISELTNQKNKLEVELISLSEKNIYEDSLSNLEIDKNKLLVVKNNLMENIGDGTRKLRELIKLINFKFNLDLGITDVDLEENLKKELIIIEKKLLESKKRKTDFSDIYKNITDYLSENYKISNSTLEELPTREFSIQMFKESQRYIQTVLDKLINVYSMTLTSSNIFRFSKDKISAKLGLEELNLKTMDVDVVIIDEASKATLLEILMPLVYGKSLILVGDYRQLPPILKLQNADIEEVNELFKKDYNYNDFYELLDFSVFKKLISANNKNVTSILKTQYRSHEQIMEIVNKFYDNQLRMETQVSEQKKHDLIISNSLKKEIINSRSSVYWIDSSYKKNNEINFEQGEEYSTSLFNDLEIELTNKILKKINEVVGEKNSMVKPSLAIISFYGLHVSKLKKFIKLSNFKNLNIVINTVDDFQGKEADYVIVNLVRNPKKLSSKTGREFLKKYERINVALSRARELLIIIGSERSVEDITVKIPTVGNPNLSNSYEVYSEIIAKLKFNNSFLIPIEID